MTDAERALLRTILEKASPGPWRIRPRDSTTREKIDPTAKWSDPCDQQKAIEVAAQDDVDVFLGWELYGPAPVGRGDFNGPDAALVAFLRNHAEDLLTGRAPPDDELPEDIALAMEQIHDFIFMAAPAGHPVAGAFAQVARQLGWGDE